MTEEARADFADLVVDRRGVARFRGRLIPCAIGKGGITNEKREGDGGTPIGVWHMESGYYRADRVMRPRTNLTLIPISSRDGWCDDPAEAAYNQPIRIPAVCSHERMRRGDGLYDIVIVLDHNRHPAEPGKGSAIFIHCWRAPRYPTAGCLAFTPKDLRWILARWDVLRSKVVIQ